MRPMTALDWELAERCITAQHLPPSIEREAMAGLHRTGPGDAIATAIHLIPILLLAARFPGVLEAIMAEHQERSTTTEFDEMEEIELSAPTSAV